MFVFSCPVNQPKEKVIQNVREGIETRDGVFTGDIKDGKFTVGRRLGRFSGNYHFEANQIVIEITRKPFYTSYERIEEVVSAYFQRQIIGTPKPTKVNAEVEDDEESLELAS